MRTVSGGYRTLYEFRAQCIISLVPSKVHWPNYSEDPSNMVWQTQGSTVEKDVSNNIGFIGVGRFTDGQIHNPSELPPGGNAVYHGPCILSMSTVSLGVKVNLHDKCSTMENRIPGNLSQSNYSSA